MTVNGNEEDTVLVPSILSEELVTSLASGLVLEPQERELYDALLKLSDGRLAGWYIGALTVLFQDTNPDRVAQAAHSIRELMEKIVVARSPQPLGVRTRNLYDKWKRNGHSAEGASCSCGLTPAFLESLHRFFDEFERDNPSRRDVAKKIIAEIDPAGLPLPGVVQEERVDVWMKLRDFFISVCHHRYECDEEELVERIEELEIFLLTFLRPRAAESQAIILDLIRYGEGGDLDNS